MHLTPRPVVGCPLPVGRLLLLALAGALAYRTLSFLPAGVLTYVPLRTALSSYDFILK